jgi:hypothetical protein
LASRRLASLANDEGVSDITEFSSLFKAAGSEVNTVILYPPEQPSIAVSIFVSVLLFIIVMGLILNYRWDTVDRAHIRSIYTAKQADKAVSEISNHKGHERTLHRKSIQDIDFQLEGNAKWYDEYE